MSMESADPGPIEDRYRDQMRALGQVLDEILNGEDCKLEDKKTGFFLTVFAFGEPSRFNYISNADKLDVRAMLKEITARIEARMARETRA